MPEEQLKPFDPDAVLSVVMGGGRGTRLFPLTRERAKPAVPLAGKYRLVDVPISNCINSGLKRVYLLTQFNSASLHRHISQSYKFDHFTHGFVEILAAEQTLSDSSWFQGTADAVRKHMTHFLNHRFDHILILSGDQLYNMDFRKAFDEHIANGAELTVATIPVNRDAVSGFGIMQIDEKQRIREFVEKPKEEMVIDSLKIPDSTRHELNIKATDDQFLASMGIYIFNRDVLVDLLDSDDADFGKHIIPKAIQTRRSFSYVYQGYWEDVGTIKTFFDANLDAASELPKFNFFDMSAPIFTRPRFLPASKINSAAIDHAVLSDGCIINRAQISHSIVGVRSVVGSGTKLHRVVMMGADFYETNCSIKEYHSQGIPAIGIGSNTRIDNAIIDKNARIGDNCVISPEGHGDNEDGEGYVVRDGIVIIQKNAVVPHGTVI
ncbi:glucose-1-phosphate adenylyltransferase [Verrucomicrobia bacterium]|nr:glucose-1-phosphate adenylyltransferase [Verrucomicrobiota bacterium]